MAKKRTTDKPSPSYETPSMDDKYAVTIPTVDEIEAFVRHIGSDDLPTFGGDFVGGAYIQQLPDEIAPCLHAILSSGERIESYFELGVASGGMTLLMDHYFKPVTIVLLDTNEHPRCVNRPGVLAGIRYTEVIGKSADDHVAQRVAALGFTYDAMMIDGVHYYENVKKDVELYAPFIRNGGFLMLHDSALPQWGVPRVVEELKKEPAWAFVGEWASTKMTPCGVALFQRVT